MRDEKLTMYYLQILLATIGEKIEKNDIEGAITLLKRAKTLIITGGVSLSYAEPIHIIANYFMALKMPKEAEDLLKRLLKEINETIKKWGSNTDLEYLKAGTQALLLQAYLMMDKHDDELLRETLSLHKKLAREQGLLDRYISFLLTIYSGVMFLQKRFPVLRRELKEALKIYEDYENNNKENLLPLVAELLVNLGEVNFSLRIYGDGVRNIIKAIKIYEDLGDEFIENFCSLLVKLLKRLISEEEVELIRTIDVFKDDLRSIILSGLKKCGDKDIHELLTTIRKRLNIELNCF